MNELFKKMLLLYKERYTEDTRGILHIKKLYAVLSSIRSLPPNRVKLSLVKLTDEMEISYEEEISDVSLKK